MPTVSGDDPNNAENVKERERLIRERYLADLERELEGARVRGDAALEKNVRDEILRAGGGGQKTAAKRPRTAAGATKETR